MLVDLVEDLGVHLPIPVIENGSHPPVVSMGLLWMFPGMLPLILFLRHGLGSLLSALEGEVTVLQVSLLCPPFQLLLLGGAQWD